MSGVKLIDPATGLEYRAGGAQDASGNTITQTGSLPAGTDRSASVATTSGQLAAANSARRGMDIQNIGANNVGINQFGAAAAIGSAGTYTLVPGATMHIRTNRQINAIAATGATNVYAIEW